jgi:hypothetical protein
MFTRKDVLKIFKEHKAGFLQVSNILLSNNEFYNSREENSSHKDIMLPDSEDRKFFSKDEWRKINVIFKTELYEISRRANGVIYFVYINSDRSGSYILYYLSVSEK